MTFVTVGVDASYTSTGVVVWDGRQAVDWIRIQTTTDDPDEVRINVISERILVVVETYQPQLTLIEDYAFSKPQGAARMGELGGVIKNKLWFDDWPFATVQPTQVKALAGSGAYNKKQMIAAAQRAWPDCPNNSDVADAYWIACYAYDNFEGFFEST